MTTTTTNPPPAAAPRLIEKWLPINEVSIEAVREGGALAGHPPVNQLHVWWACRPLIASRAAIAASMLPIRADRERFSANIWHYYAELSDFSTSGPSAPPAICTPTTLPNAAASSSPTAL